MTGEEAARMWMTGAGGAGEACCSGAGGIGGLIITALIIWISGGNPLSVLNNAGSITGNQMAQNYVPTAGGTLCRVR